jgi:ethanolamine utilization protein EutN
MRLARVIGTVTAAQKDAALAGRKLLLCDIVDGEGAVLDPAQVAVDSVGAGAGDLVLISTGSAARLPSQTTGAPVDAVILGVVDRVVLA